MSVSTPQPDPSDPRVLATKRLEAQRNFRRMVGMWVILSLFLTIIWALTDIDGFFWPIWAMFGFGIALAFTGWYAYGPRDRGIDEDAIQREMNKMQK